MTKKPSCKGPLTNRMRKVLASTQKLVESGTNPSGRLVLNSVKENGRKAFLTDQATNVLRSNAILFKLATLYGGRPEDYE